MYIKKAMLGGVLLYAGLVKAGDAPLLLDKVIATIDKEIILYSDLEEIAKSYALQREAVDEVRKMKLLGKFIVQKMFLAEANASDVKMPEAMKQNIQKECDRHIAYLLQQAGSQAKLTAHFQQPLYRVKEQLKRYHEETSLVDLVKHKITQEATVTPAEVKAYFYALPSHKRPYYPTAFDVRQLVVYPKVAIARKEAVKNQLLQLKNQLLQDATLTFAELAEKHSEDLQTAAKGGDIGWVSVGMLDPAYEEAALALKVGEVSDPVVSEVGVHLVLLVDRNKDQYHTYHILKVLEPTEGERQLAKATLKQVREDIMHGTLTMEEAIQQHSEDHGSRSIGGLLPQAESEMQGLLLSAEDLDSSVYFAIEQLKEGDISQPQAFTHGQHKAGWRLLCLKQRVDAHMMNLTQDYGKIYHQLLGQKKQVLLHKWLQAAKKRFVIYIDPDYHGAQKWF